MIEKEAPHDPIVHLPTDPAATTARAFLYDRRDGAMVDLNDLIPEDSGWQLTFAADVNDAGQVVGQGTVGGEAHAFLLTPVG